MGKFEDFLSDLNPLGKVLDFGFDVASNAISYDQQKALARDSRNWAEKMYHLNNEYNTPLNQRKRLDEAGVNGALLLSGSNTGNGQTPSASSPSAPPMPQSSTLSDYVKQMHLQRKQHEFDTVLRDKELEIKDAELRHKVEETNALKIENTWREENILEDLGIKKQTLRNLLFRNDMDERTKELQYKQIFNATEQSIIQTSEMRLQHEMSKTRYSYLPKQLQAEINLMYAQTAAQAAAATLSMAQADHETYKQRLTQQMILNAAADRWKTTLEANGIILSNRKCKAMMEYEINKARNNQGADNLYQMLQNGSAEDIAFSIGLSALPLGGALKGLKWLKHSRHLKRFKQTGANTFEWF